MIAPASPIDLLSNMTGSESMPVPSSGGGFPQALEVSEADMKHALNPLQYVPVVGMVYRAATGEQIPSTIRVMAAGVTAGPLGMVGAGLFGLLEELFKMGPDTSRPSTPVGMAQTGSESGVEPVTPGSLREGEYTTLATTTPAFLDRTDINTAIAQNGAAAYRVASMEQQMQQFDRGTA